VNSVQVRVRVGGEQYALPVEHVHEVVDLASILQIEHDEHPRRLLITQCDGQRAAFAVDEVLDVGPLDGTMQESDSPHLLASMVLDGAMVGMLAVDGLFASIAPEAQR
jgi:chemotaxis signal transduction protein